STGRTCTVSWRRAMIQAAGAPPPKGTHASQLDRGAREQPPLRCPDRELGAGTETKFAQNIADMPIGGALYNDQTLGDLSICPTVRHKRGDLLLAARQALHRYWAAHLCIRKRARTCVGSGTATVRVLVRRVRLFDGTEVQECCALGFANAGQAS